MSRPNMYRGIVVYNQDPLNKGRVKIYVPGIYPIEFKNVWNKLPWAQPAMPLGGGNWANERLTPVPYTSMDDAINTNPLLSNSAKGILDTDYDSPITTTVNQQGTAQPQLNLQTGFCTVPHAGKLATDGAQVWLFFENGDINFPIYFAAVQSGTGWFSEHPNQHVFKSDNVTFRIDQNATLLSSTCKYTTYNKKCIHYQNPKQNIPITGVPTLVDINILNLKKNAINVAITGNVNLQIIGNVYIEHTGDRYETHLGNSYINHIGDTFIERTGNVNQHIISGNTKCWIDKGDLDFKRVGKEKIVNIGDITHTHTGNKKQTITGKQQRTVTGPVKQTFAAAFEKTVGGATKFKSAVVQWALALLNFK